MVWRVGATSTGSFGRMVTSIRWGSVSCRTNFLLSELAQGRTDSLIHGVSYLITTRGDESAGSRRLSFTRRMR
jgi:hypothetical protein